MEFITDFCFNSNCTRVPGPREPQAWKRLRRRCMFEILGCEIQCTRAFPWVVSHCCSFSKLSPIQKKGNTTLREPLCPCRDPTDTSERGNVCTKLLYDATHAVSDAAVLTVRTSEGISMWQECLSNNAVRQPQCNAFLYKSRLWSRWLFIATEHTNQDTSIAKWPR